MLRILIDIRPRRYSETANLASTLGEIKIRISAPGSADARGWCHVFPHGRKETTIRHRESMPDTYILNQIAVRAYGIKASRDLLKPGIRPWRP